MMMLPPSFRIASRTSRAARSSAYSVPSCAHRAARCHAALHTAASLRAKAAPTSPLRNISIWGHIDAGKTTLTERILYLSGTLSPPAADGAAAAPASAAAGRAPGDVDSGSTVTDFLEEERRRGITIQSAAVGPFAWKVKGDGKGEAHEEAQITLVDTPGHIDFTIEVERSLRVADGCVVLIDGVEGVESQTEGVWAIAQRYNLRSHVVFINKLDRAGSSVPRSLESIARQLHPTALLLQLPIPLPRETGADEAGVAGTVDLISMRARRYQGAAGEELNDEALPDAVKSGYLSAELAAEAAKARYALIESLAGVDDALLDELLSSTSDDAHAELSAASIRAAVRRQVHAGTILPVLCGSAGKNVGVQDVLDAVVRYFPSPAEAGDLVASKSRGKETGSVWATVEGAKAALPRQRAHRKQGSAAASQDGPQAPGSEEPTEPSSKEKVAVSVQDRELSALAFKVVWDKRKGPMTFVRVYSGTLTRSSSLLNTTNQTKERLSKLLLPYADRYVETEELKAGQIGVLLGLRDTRTGDTLVDAKLNRAAASQKGSAPWAVHAQSLRLRRVDVPPPVFSMSIEPRGKADEAAVSEALAMLVRTDPSLRLDEGGEGSADTVGLGSAGTGQTVLSGMGELHLEIARNRLETEFGVKARMGGVRVSYRETILDGKGAVEVEELLEKDMMGRRVKAGCTVSVRALHEDEVGDESLGGNLIYVELDDTQAQAGNETRSAAKQAVVAVTSKAAPENTNITPPPAEVLDPEAMRTALMSGLTAALSRGPLSSNPLSGLHVTLHSPLTFGAELSPPRALGAAAGAALLKAVRQRGAQMMEPMMAVKVRCAEAHLGKVVSDLTSEQGASVTGVDHEGHAASGETGAASTALHVYIPPDEDAGAATSSGGAGSHLSAEAARHKTSVHALAPLARLVSYSSRLRALTAGSGTFTMRLQGFAPVGAERQIEILRELGRA